MGKSSLFWENYLVFSCLVFSLLRFTIQPNFFIQPNLHFRGELKRCRRRHLLRIILRQGKKSSLRSLFSPLETSLVLVQLKYKTTHANIIYSRLRQFACQFELDRKVRLAYLLNLFDCLQILATAKAKGWILKEGKQRMQNDLSFK